MLNSEKWPDFLREYAGSALFSAIIIAVAVFSFSNLTTKPRIWVDETVTMELARSFSRSGVLDIQTSPDGFSGFPHLLQSTGYPVTVPLAVIFRIFGYEFPAVRIFMLVLMLIFLAAVYFFCKELFGPDRALLTVLLTASFSSFYGSGRTAVGEVPGFIFLILAMYFWLNRSSYYLSGLFLGLAVVTKPAVFLLAIPAFAFGIFLGKKDFFRELFRLSVGMAPAAMAWIFLVLGDPFSKNIWLSILNFYRNPYSSDTAGNFMNNLLNFPHSATLIYFTGLLVLVAAGCRLSGDRRLKSFGGFVIIYCLLAFIYYLRSPGWLRYILIAEFLIFISLPWALSEIFSKIGALIPRLGSGRAGVFLAAGFLVSVQLFRLFNGAQIFHSDSEIKAAGYINENFPGRSVGIVDSPKLSVLLDTDMRYQVVTLAGIPPIGSASFLEENFPDILAFGSGQIFSEKELSGLNDNYTPVVAIGGYEIYEKF